MMQKRASTFRLLAGGLLLALGIPHAAAAHDILADAGEDTHAGELTIDRPTLVSLGYQWDIAGDDNRNAAVEVQFRAEGQSVWQEGLPPLRLMHEEIPSIPAQPFGYTVPNAFAGSILNLEPDTAYEVRLILSDADGTEGQVERQFHARTRAVPVAATGGQTYHVYPFGYDGPRQEPSFIGLLEAYYEGSSHGDSNNSYPPRVQPGDVIEIHAGLYRDDWQLYGGFNPGQTALGTVGTGTYMLTQSGTADRPIVIRAAGDGEVIFDGNGTDNLFNLLAADYTHLEGFTIRDANLAVLAGWKRITGASGIVVKDMRFENVGRAVFSDWAGSDDFYIADNVVLGRNPRGRLLGWSGEIWRDIPGFPQRLESEYAFKIYGRGHVVAYNTIRGFHDGIDFATWGPPTGVPTELLPGATDFYGNDISEVDDDCIEADGAARNIRVFANRCVNMAAGGFSAQPIFGGPAYFYRNIVYNGVQRGAVKWMPGPAGLVYYNNTFVAEVVSMTPAQNVHFRNNVFLHQSRDLPIFDVWTATDYSTSDYNAFAPFPGTTEPFGWTITDEVPVDRRAAVPRDTFASLAAYTAATGQDRHSLIVPFSVFETVQPTDRSDIQLVYDPATLDFRPKSNSPLIDAGNAIPTITDGFSGRAPDLGAIEFSDDQPHYGSRTRSLGSEGP